MYLVGPGRDKNANILENIANTDNVMENFRYSKADSEGREQAYSYPQENSQ